MNSNPRSPVVWSTIAVCYAFASFAWVTTHGGSTGATVTIGVALVLVVWAWIALMMIAMYRNERREKGERERDHPSRMPPPDEFWH